MNEISKGLKKRAVQARGPGFFRNGLFFRIAHIGGPQPTSFLGRPFQIRDVEGRRGGFGQLGRCGCWAEKP